VLQLLSTVIHFVSLALFSDQFLRVTFCLTCPLSAHSIVFFVRIMYPAGSSYSTPPYLHAVWIDTGETLRIEQCVSIHNLLWCTASVLNASSIVHFDSLRLMHRERRLQSRVLLNSDSRGKISTMIIHIHSSFAESDETRSEMSLSLSSSDTPPSSPSLPLRPPRVILLCQPTDHRKGFHQITDRLSPGIEYMCFTPEQALPLPRDL
jgi:hypothetical protein